MINQIISFHKELKKGESVKILTGLKDYVTYINRTDILKQDGNILIILRANGGRVAINTDFVISCCIIERF
jgi:hypothetical protein